MFAFKRACTMGNNSLMYGLIDLSDPRSVPGTSSYFNASPPSVEDDDLDLPPHLHRQPPLERVACGEIRPADAVVNDLVREHRTDAPPWRPCRACAFGFLGSPSRFRDTA